MVTVKKLIEAKRNKKLGNHRVEIYNTGSEVQRYYYYHATAVVVVDYINQTITTNNGGWNTPSTNRTINAYLRELDYLGYEIIDTRGGKKYA